MQRLWITDNALNQFEFLADMDSELRSCISQMEMCDKSPSDYAVVIKQSPSAGLLRLSSKNKMQSAVSAEMNYSGMHSQTDKFIEDDAVLTGNYSVGEEFIKSLGPGTGGQGKLGRKCFVWSNVPFDCIYNNLLLEYRFHKKLVAFQNIEAIKKWVDKVTGERKLQDWNVILFGVDRGVSTSFAGYKVNKVRRTRKFIREGTIDLGVLTDPKEKVADVDYATLSPDGKELYDNYRTDQAYLIREDAGLAATPSIVLYIVDKDSKANSSNRHDLNATYDILGLSINIPGNRINDSYACSVMIDLNKYGLGSDIEGEDEYED